MSTAARARVRAALMTGTACQSAGRRPHVVRVSGYSHTLIGGWFLRLNPNPKPNSSGQPLTLSLTLTLAPHGHWPLSTFHDGG